MEKGYCSLKNHLTAHSRLSIKKVFSEDREKDGSLIENNLSNFWLSCHLRKKIVKHICDGTKRINGGQKLMR